MALDVAVPAALAIVGLLVARAAVGDDGIQELINQNRATAYGTLAAVAGSLLGFAITLIPLLHALLSLEGLRMVRESPHAASLFAATIHTVGALGVLCGISLTAMIFDRDGSPLVVLQYLTFVAVAVSAWKLTRAVHLMWLTLDVALQAYRASREDREDR